MNSRDWNVLASLFKSGLVRRTYFLTGNKQTPLNSFMPTTKLKRRIVVLQENNFSRDKRGKYPASKCQVRASTLSLLVLIVFLTSWQQWTDSTYFTNSHVYRVIFGFLFYFQINPNYSFWHRNILISYQSDRVNSNTRKMFTEKQAGFDISLIKLIFSCRRRSMRTGFKHFGAVRKQSKRILRYSI